MSDGATYPLREGVNMLIGRGKGCDVRIVDDNHLSRRHVVITCLSDRVLIADLGSANGTWLNGGRLQERMQYELQYQEPFYLSKEQYRIERS